MLDSLTDLLYNWCKSQDLEYLSADDLLIGYYQELTQKHEHVNGRNLTHIKVGDPIGPPFCTEFRCGSF